MVEVNVSLKVSTPFELLKKVHSLQDEFQLIRILANMLPNQVAQNANKQTIHEGDKQLH